MGDNIKTEGDGDADDDLVGVKADFVAGIVRDDDGVATVVAGSTDDGRRLSSLSRGKVDVMMGFSIDRIFSTSLTFQFLHTSLFYLCLLSLILASY
jgi:hypothetical protein